jgi:cytochrome b6-f complex iron-sulfur subunit
MESDEKNVSRRGFLNTLLAGGAAGVAAAVAYPVAQFVIPPDVAEASSDAVIAAKEGELGPDEWKIFPLGAEPGILIRTAEGEYLAFSAVCEHLQCTVVYRAELGQILCPCHNGRFDMTGRNVAGPPPRPLEQLAVNKRGDEIVVSRRTT